MKVLYAALRHDPRNPDLASGVDHNFYTAFLREGLEVRIVGPFTDAPPLFERALKKLYIAASGKRYLKWDLQSVWRSSQALNQFEKSWHPDIVFSIFPAPGILHWKCPMCIQYRHHVSRVAGGRGRIWRFSTKNISMDRTQSYSKKRKNHYI